MSFHSIAVPFPARPRCCETQQPRPHLRIPLPGFRTAAVRSHRVMNPASFKRCVLGTENLAEHRILGNRPVVKAKNASLNLKRGRPTGPTKKRINARFPESLAERIEYAAALRGVAVASFIQEAVAARAEEVIEAEARWQLTREQAAAVVAMIANPPKANKRMLEAAKLASRHVVIRD